MQPYSHLLCSALSLRKFLLLLLCLSLTPNLQGVIASDATYREDLPDPLSNTGWRLQLQRDDIEIYTRPWPGSNFVAIKAEQVIAAPLSRIVAHYANIAAFPEWVKDMSEARAITSMDQNRERLVYMRMDMPWPLQDRDIVAGQRYEQDPESKVVSVKEWHEAGVLPKIDDVVRVPRTNMELILIPESANRTRFIFQGHNEPGGIIPSFLVNWMIEDIFYTSMLNMRQRFESPLPQHTADWVEDFKNHSGD
ncbi:MAG: START domain-containing protein [Oleiphilaceae bacterium]|nr:START domain-containing protein [Oleiphilaceae bacterium]